MSIRPQYAEAILDGSKQVEFRKRRLADDVTTVIIYMTAPVMAVVGHFTVAGQVVDEPHALWERFESVAGIDAEGFHDYFAASDEGVGIVIEHVTVYDTPVPLQQIDPGGQAPQSYKYLPAETLSSA